jgi:Trk-type K+ transport system membrane component
VSRPSEKISSTVVAITDQPHRIVITTGLVVCVSGALDFALLTLLAHINVSRLSLRIQNSILTGLVSGGLVWALLVLVALRRRHLRTKLQVVADLNHELRNALEIILQSGYLPEGQRHSALRDSAERISNALDDIAMEARATGLIRPD